MCFRRSRKRQTAAICCPLRWRCETSLIFRCNLRVIFVAHQAVQQELAAVREAQQAAGVEQDKEKEKERGRGDVRDAQRDLARMKLEENFALL